MESTGLLIHRAAVKGAAMGNTAAIGRMCNDCAFKLGSDANLEEFTTTAAVDCLAYWMQKFNCHIEAGINAGMPCKGFLYAKQYYDKMNNDLD